jgi:hypothetical protein
VVLAAIVSTCMFKDLINNVKQLMQLIDQMAVMWLTIFHQWEASI